tara:strand:- start:2702 stop:3868 length:1167 start_codon:yes stop_codon:yes gene_type:complete
MSEWKIKGVVEDTEQKSSQQEEQAVLDQAVEKGTITPESAGQEEEIPKINLNEPVPEAEPQQESAVEEVIEEKPTVETDEFVSDSPLELITEEIESEDNEAVTETVQEVQEEQLPQVTLPENVDKLVKFMEETGGSVEDYVNLNKDVDSMKEGDMLREYYKQSKPWDTTEIEEYLEDNFAIDEDVDEPREVRAKKRAFKEELFNAKRFLENNKQKYYADLKLRKQQDIPVEYKEATEYYNNYKSEIEQTEQAAKTFLKKTDEVFNSNFKGFDFQVGDNKYRLKVSNQETTKTEQSDLNNFLKPFLNDNGEMQDAAGYHKALFTARNADKLAEHFYEQGRADALRNSAKEAKNINMDPRQQGVVKTSAGQKFKVVSGDSSSKLKMKLRK